MGDADMVGDPARVVDVLAGAAGSGLNHRFPVVVELERDAHHVIALIGEHGGGDGAVDAARHSHHHPRFRWNPVKAQRINRDIHCPNMGLADARNKDASKWRGCAGREKEESLPFFDPGRLDGLEDFLV